MNANPSAFKFNVSKKLGQLMKVIQLFQSQIEEQGYQKQFLYNSYDPPIQDILANYIRDSTDIDTKMKDDYLDLNSKISKLYNGKVDGLKNDFTAYLDASISNTNDFAKKMSYDMNEVKIFFEKLENRIETVTTHSLSQSESFMNSLPSIISERKKVFENELDTIKKESSSRINKLISENSQKIEGILSMNKKIIFDVTNNTDSINNDEQIRLLNVINQLKSRLSKAKTDLYEMKDILFVLLEENQKQTNNSRHSLAQLKKISNDGSQNIANDKQTIEREISKKREDLSLSFNKLNETYAQNQKYYEEALKTKKTSIDGDLKYLKNEFTLKSEKIRSDLDSSCNEIQILIDKNRDEIDNIKAKHELSEKELDININTQQNAIHSMKSDLGKQIELFQKQLESVHIDFQNKKKVCATDHISQRELIIQKFEKEKEIILSKKSNEYENKKSDIEKHNQILNRIKNDIEYLRKENEQKIIDYEKVTIDKVQNTIKENDEELKMIVENNAETLKNVSKSDTMKLSEMNERYENEYQKLIDKFVENHEETMKNLRNNGMDGKEVSDLLTYYRNLAESEIETLNQLTNMIPSQFNPGPIQKEIEELQKQKVDLIRINEAEKNHLIDIWENRLENEKSRHDKVCNYSADPASNDMINQLHQEISNEIRLKRDSEQKHNETMEKENIDFEKIMNDHTENLKNSRDSTIIVEKQNIVTSIKDEIDAYDRTMNGHISSDLANFNFEKASLTQEHNQGMQKCVESHGFDYMNQQNQIEELKTQLESFEKMKSCEINQMETKRANRAEWLISKHIANVDVIIKSLENLKLKLIDKGRDFQKLYTNNRSRLQSTLEEIQKGLRNDLHQQSRQWEAMKEFYEEKISVCQNERNIAKGKFDERPSRNQEITEIEKLTSSLHIITQRLQNATKEIREYRNILIKQEGEYNTRFGNGPKVGVLKMNNTHTV